MGCPYLSLTGEKSVFVSRSQILLECLLENTGK